MSCSTVEYIFSYNSPSDLTREQAAEMLSRSETVDNVFEGRNVDVVQANYDETIDFSDKLSSYNFSTGKSFFKTYKLPLAASNMRFVVTSYIGKTMAIPDIALFNSKKKLIKVIRYSAFTYTSANDFGMRSMRFSLAINNFSAGDNAVQYAVLFITNESRNSSTTLPNPAKEFQQAAHNDTSGFADVVVPHSSAELCGTTTSAKPLVSLWAACWNSFAGFGRVVEEFLDSFVINSTAYCTALSPAEKLLIASENLMLLMPKSFADVYVNALYLITLISFFLLLKSAISGMAMVFPI